MADSAQLLLDTEANGTQRTMVDDLLEDLWRMVFAHCSTLDLVRICMLVCQQWRVWAKEITERAIILNSNWKGYNGELQHLYKGNTRDEQLFHGLAPRMEALADTLKVLVFNWNYAYTSGWDTHFLRAIEECPNLVVLEMGWRPSTHSSSRSNSFLLMPPALRILRTGHAFDIASQAQRPAALSILETPLSFNEVQISSFRGLQALKLDVSESKCGEKFLKPESLLLLRHLHLVLGSPTDEAFLLTVLAPITQCTQLEELIIDGAIHLTHDISILDSHETLKKVYVRCNACSYSAMQHLLGMQKTTEIRVKQLSKHESNEANDFQINSSLEVFSIGSSSLKLTIDLEEFLVRAPKLKILEVGCQKISLALDPLRTEKEWVHSHVQAIKFCSKTKFSSKDDAALRLLGFNISSFTSELHSDGLKVFEAQLLPTESPAYSYSREVMNSIEKNSLPDNLPSEVAAHYLSQKANQGESPVYKPRQLLTVPAVEY